MKKNLLKELRSVRLSSKYMNIGKKKFLQCLEAEVIGLKNQMSAYIFVNIEELIVNGWMKFSSHYKEFNSPLTAWETQHLFQDICKLYLNDLDKYTDQLNFMVQDGYKIKVYKRTTKTHKKGDRVSIGLKFKRCSLTSLLEWLIYIPNFTNADQIYNTEVRDKFKSLSPIVQQRLIKYITYKQKKLFGKLKPKVFQNGNYIKDGYQTSRHKLHCIFEDCSNSLYKIWYAYKTKSGFVYFPLMVNEKYHTDYKTNVLHWVQFKNGRLDIITTRDVEPPVFDEQGNIVGIDINLKHNFLSCSNGLEVDYNRQYLEILIKQISKFDKIGYKNLNPKQFKGLKKLVARNEWFFRSEISKFLKYCKDNNITDLVMEDLDLSTKFGNSPEFGIPFSRLVRLCHLNNIKNWMKSQAEKIGIRVHITPSPYTSQQCPKCGNIDSNNRKTQENFKCTECGHKSNADHNASINIRNRYTLDVLRLSGLHKIDAYGRLEPKTTSKYRVKEILLELEAEIDRSIGSVA